MATDFDGDDLEQRPTVSKSEALGALDTLTAIQLGQALFCTLVGATEEPDLDEIHWEDTGVSVKAFLELDDYDTRNRVLELIEQVRPAT